MFNVFKLLFFIKLGNLDVLKQCALLPYLPTMYYGRGGGQFANVVGLLRCYNIVDFPLQQQRC